MLSTQSVAGAEVILQTRAIKGFKDILPDEVHIWQRIETVARGIFRCFGFSEIRVPVLERTSLFVRSIGEETDIVEKEMYTFTDRNGDSLTMRPEGTAPVLRAYVEHALHLKSKVARLYTIGPMFRHERPQKGRLRQFHQMSAEVLGAADPFTDAEVMAAAHTILAELGAEASLEINSLGCPDCRPAYNRLLVDYLRSRTEKLCSDCRRRLDKNPLRVLDCKNETCRAEVEESPAVTAHLCAPCAEHFAAVKENLASLGVPFRENRFMVRGLDYYRRTTFELVTDRLGAQSAVGAGGRYDGLVESLGGPKNTPGIGFAIGMERLVLLMAEKERGLPPGTDLFIAALGDEARGHAFRLMHALRLKETACLMDTSGGGLKSQMKQAGKTRAGHTLIIGDDELASGLAILRDMETGDQKHIPVTEDIETTAAHIAAELERGE